VLEKRGADVDLQTTRSKRSLDIAQQSGKGSL